MPRTRTEALTFHTQILNLAERMRVFDPPESEILLQMAKRIKDYWNLQDSEIHEGKVMPAIAKMEAESNGIPRCFDPRYSR